MTIDRKKRLARLERLAQAGAHVKELTDEEMARYERIAAVLWALCQVRCRELSEAGALQQMGEKGITEADGRRYLAMGYDASRDELMPFGPSAEELRLARVKEVRMNAAEQIKKAHMVGEVKVPGGPYRGWLQDE